MVKWPNEFPTKGGIPKTMSPSMIVEEKPNPDFNQDRIVFGSNVLVYIGTRKNTNIRSIPSVALNESNYHGGYYFMNLYTRKIL